MSSEIAEEILYKLTPQTAEQQFQINTNVSNNNNFITSKFTLEELDKSIKKSKSLTDLNHIFVIQC